MLEARLTKTKIMSENGGTLLVGVVEYGDERMNFKVPYDWNEIDEAREAFSLAIRDKIAYTFDIPVYHVDMGGDQFIEDMFNFYMMDRGFVF